VSPAHALSGTRPPRFSFQAVRIERLPVPRAAWVWVWLAAFGVTMLSAPRPLVAQVETLRGVLHVVWDAEPDGTDPDQRLFFLVQPDGSAVRLLSQPDLLAPAGAHALGDRDRRFVEIVGVRVRPVEDAVLVSRVLEVADLRAAPPPLPSVGASYAFVTVLCRFSDDASTPFSRADVETVHGSSYPGMQQYYAEMSWDPGIMSGSTVTDWYDLPHPRSHYVDGTTTQLGELATDCAGAAQNDVDFRNYYGINLQVNGALATRATPPHDVLSLGGSWSATLNGQFRSWGMTWLSGQHHGNYVVVAHEMGHALGWPHSSGKYGSEYDSRWDVMSAGYLRWEPPFGWLTIHTIAHHKNIAGWVPPDRRWVPTSGSTQSGTIRRTAHPSQGGYVMAEIPIGGNRSYTIEARRLAGHDSPLPYEAIVIHETIGSRAYVVEDPQNSGNPNGPGAAWLPGETFVDATNGITVTVAEMLADAFVVNISLAGAPTCAVAVIANPAAGGTAVIASGGATGACGRTVTVAATANDGWGFVRWTEGEAEVSTNASYAFAPASNRSLVAHFEQPCAVAVIANPAAGGTAVIASGGATGACGRTVTLAASPNPGWVFVNWTDGSIGFSFDSTMDLVPAADRSLSAIFVQATGLATRLLETLLGQVGTLTLGEREMLDRNGNQNGILDLGDFLAFLDRHPGVRP
jgi:M6 family metalloprotease-like protein